MRGKIACYVHANREAVTSCGVCGHRLCAACAINDNGIDYCDSCAPANAVRPSFDSDYERIPVLPSDKAIPASFMLRLRAWLVDVMMFVFLGAAIGILFWMFTGRIEWVYSPRKGGLAFFGLWFGLLIVGTAYAGIIDSMTGQTFGKKLIGVIVLKPDGHILDWRSSATRAMALVLSVLPFGLGCLWMLWDPEGLAWHDKIAGTRVYEYDEVS